MRTRHLLTIATLLLATTACKPDAAEADPTPGAGPVDDGAIRNDATRTSDAASSVARPAATQGGAFARKPGCQLPVPVSTTPMGANSIPQSRQADPVEIRTALMEQLEASGPNIQVQVSAGGIVSLSGEVATLAEAQQAHYVARALPGVVEVDYRNLRVRQR